MRPWNRSPGHCARGRRGAVQADIEAAPRMVMHLAHNAVHAGAVGMASKQCHQHADAHGIALRIGIVGGFDLDHAAVSRCQDGSRQGRQWLASSRLR